ncbi:hypothetical protein MRX96_040260 [Rhipicephalus microplus]
MFQISVSNVADANGPKGLTLHEQESEEAGQAARGSPGNYDGKYEIADEKVSSYRLPKPSIASTMPRHSRMASLRQLRKPSREKLPNEKKRPFSLANRLNWSL